MLEPLSPLKQFRLLLKLDNRAAIGCCNNDEGTARQILSNKRPIGPKLGARIHIALWTTLSNEYGVPLLNWGKQYNDILARIREVVVISKYPDRRIPAFKLLNDQLMLMVRNHPCGEDCEDRQLLIERAAQNLASAMLLFCLAPHLEGTARYDAPRLAARRTGTAIRLLEHVQDILEAQRASPKDIAENRHRLAYAHVNNVAMYSEFRSDRIEFNGGFATFSEDEVLAAMKAAADVVYDLFLIIKPDNPIKRILSNNLLSMASRCHQLQRAGEAWAALIHEWPQARDLAHPQSGTDRALAADSDLQWLIATLGGVTNFDETPFAK